MNWFNNNTGFWSFLLSFISVITCIVTAYLAYKVGMMPYRHGLQCSFSAEYDKNCGSYFFIGEIINLGPATVNISYGFIQPVRHIGIKGLFYRIKYNQPIRLKKAIKQYTNDRFSILQLSFSGKKDFVEIAPNESARFVVIADNEMWTRFLDEYSIDLNYWLEVTIYERGKNKPIRVNDCFDVG